METLNTVWQFMLQINYWFWIPVVIGIYIGLKLLIFLGRIWKHKNRPLVYLRITLPRKDSKLDLEKRTEKDFREQLAKAEQFFRALHETRELNLYNTIVHRMIFGKPQISFELQFRNRRLHFVVVCDPYYQNIIQKQITTYFESAEIEPLPPEEQFRFDPKKEEVNGYFFHTVKKYWYPIQTYKKIEDDPLNGLANSFAKLQPDEKAVIQFIVHPRNKRWQKKAEAQGTKLFKGKKKSTGINIPIIGPILNILWTPIRILIRGFNPQTDMSTSAPGASSGDAYVRMLQSEEEIAKSIGLGNRTNTIMQSAFFKIANIIPYDLAVKEMKNFIVKTFGKDRKSTRLNSSHIPLSRMPSSA